MRRARRGIQPGLTQGGIVFPGGGGRPTRYAAHVARVAVLTPFAFPSVRGNAITAERIVAGLREPGEEVPGWDLSATAEAGSVGEDEAFRPALCIAFQAYGSAQ